AIEKVISAAAGTGGRAHIVHLSAAECVAMIAGAKAAGIRLTAETCPHYLYFPADQGRGQPRGAVAGPGSRRDRLRGDRPLAVPARAEVPRLGRLRLRGFRPGLGRYRLPPARPVRGVDGGPA